MRRWRRRQRYTGFQERTEKKKYSDTTKQTTDTCTYILNSKTVGLRRCKDFYLAVLFLGHDFTSVVFCFFSCQQGEICTFHRIITAWLMCYSCTETENRRGRFLDRYHTKDRTGPKESRCTTVKFGSVAKAHTPPLLRSHLIQVPKLTLTHRPSMLLNLPNNKMPYLNIAILL